MLYPNHPEGADADTSINWKVRENLRTGGMAAFNHSPQTYDYISYIIGLL